MRRERAARSSVDYDLQAKCSRDGEAWFQRNFPTDRDTLLMSPHYHYNREQNKCFLTVENHYKMFHNDSEWTNSITVWDIYENSEYANFAENHYINAKVDPSDRAELISCTVRGEKCASIDSFDGLINHFMQN